MPRNQLGDGQSQRFGIAIVAVTCLVAPLWADIDPNASEPYADGGYGIIVCGNSTISADPNVNDSLKDFLRESFLYLTEVRGIEPDDIFVRVDDGRHPAAIVWNRSRDPMNTLSTRRGEREG